LPDDAVPPSDVDGNFVIGPTHNPAPEMVPLDESVVFHDSADVFQACP
jgi:hypothetical protein